MANLNKVMLIGRLGQDPELKNYDGGNPACKFTVATNENWTDKKSGEKIERTEWHKIVLWGKLAELANEYLRSGSEVYLEGKLQTSNWQDEETGVKRYKTEVVVFKLEFINSKSQDEKINILDYAPKEEGNDQQNIKRIKDDIPF